MSDIRILNLFSCNAVLPCSLLDAWASFGSFHMGKGTFYSVVTWIPLVCGISRTLRLFAICKDLGEWKHMQ